jgi:hypothetical protein
MVALVPLTVASEPKSRSLTDILAIVVRLFDPFLADSNLDAFALMGVSPRRRSRPGSRRNSTQMWGRGTPGVAATVRRGPAVVGTGEGTSRGVSRLRAASQANSALTVYTVGVLARWMRRT